MVGNPNDMGLDPSDLNPPEEHPGARILMDAMDEIAEARQENWDSLGISAGVVGEECMRKVWYGFRWVLPTEAFSAKTLSIFETGNIWEDRIVQRFKDVCANVWDADERGRQFSVNLLNGFVRGKCDLIVQGVPGFSADEAFVVEVKSMNKAGFNASKKHGIKKAKPAYYGQLQSYLRFFGYRRGMLAFVCKDNDEFHIEVIDRDDGYMNTKLANVENTIKSRRPPAKITQKSDSYTCRFCNFKDVCHNGAMPERRSCRTCIHAAPVLCDNKYPVFQCGRTDSPMDTSRQKQGCEYHLFETSLIPGEVIETSEENETITYKMADGSLWTDGTGRLQADDEKVA